jgi:hypothetical protein
MTKIQIFDPALCCSTGVCGTDADQVLINFSADLNFAKNNGTHIERFNLAQEPMIFVQNGIVKNFIEKSGEESLPLIIVDDAIVLAGRYPTREEILRWAKIVIPTTEKSSSSCCGPKSSCC